MVPLSYPAEWLLDIFNSGFPARTSRIFRAPYIFEVPSPPMPWILDNGWWVLPLLLTIEIFLGGHLCHVL